MEGVNPIAARIAAQGLVNDASSVANCATEANNAAAGVGHSDVMAAANSSIEGLTTLLGAFTELLEAKATAIELAASGVDYGLVGSIDTVVAAAQLALQNQLEGAYGDVTLIETGKLAPETADAAIKALEASKSNPAAMAAVFSGMPVETQVEIGQSRPDLVAALLSEMESIHPVLKSDLTTTFGQTLNKSSFSVDGNMELKAAGRYIKIGVDLKGQLLEKSDGPELILTGGGEMGAGGTLSGLHDAELGLLAGGEQSIKIAFPAGYDVEGLLGRLEGAVSNDLPGDDDFDVRDAVTGPMGSTREVISQITAEAHAAGGSVTTEFTGSVALEGEVDFTKPITSAPVAQAINVGRELSFDGELKWEASDDGSERVVLHGGAELAAKADVLIGNVKGPKFDFGYDVDAEIVVGIDSSGQKYYEYTLEGGLAGSADYHNGKMIGLGGGLDVSHVKRTARVEIDDFWSNPLSVFGDDAEVTISHTNKWDSQVNKVDIDVTVFGQGVTGNLGNAHSSSTTTSVTVKPPGGDFYDPLAAGDILIDIPDSQIGGQCEITLGQ